MKKFSLIALLSVLTVGALVGCGNKNSSETPNPSSSETPVSSEVSSETPVSSEEPVETVELPAPWAEGETTFERGHCSVALIPAEGQKSVKDYLTTPGIRFIDLRDVTEGYGSHVQGFESISYFNVIVGEGHLFTANADGTVFTPNYPDSELYLNKIFPKDQVLFLMCQGGVRVQPCIRLLQQYGYDMTKVYNVGGWGQVEKAKQYGGYSVSTGISATTGAITYDFSKVSGVTATQALRRTANTTELPTPWGENESTFERGNCSVALIPAEGQKSVKDYLNVPGIRFIDLRDQSEGYGSHVEKFESVSYFNVIVGEGHLFTANADGTVFTPNYPNSELYLNKIFPKDQVLFLMCQGGVRVQPCIRLLQQYGYDMTKVYNVGGWGQVEKAKQYGGYNVSTGISAATGSITYDFSKLTVTTAA